MKQESYTIFYSWQSDDSKARHLIDKALEDAVQRIKQENHIVIEIDKSTLNVPGMPEIIQTIKKKIDKCDIFLCDLTPIAKCKNEKDIIKNIPNANVLVELGYAMSALGGSYIIPLCHQGEFNVGNLPFDINHYKIGLFNSRNLDLVEPILEVVKYIRKNGSHRQMTEPYWISMVKLFVQRFSQIWSPKYDRKAHTIYQPSTIFFRERMCDAFPGKRGIVEYTSIRDITICLKQLLRSPIKFDCSAIDKYVTDPIWWFCDGDATSIDEFEHIGGRRFRFWLNEYIVSRIIAYVDNVRYYSNYVYVETIPDEPLSIYSKPSQECLDQGYYTQEYAEYKVCPFISKKITRHEYDDGCFKWCGKTIFLNGRANLRSRTMTPYSFIIAAKFSPYNCDAFDRTSMEKFSMLREGIISKTEFNEYMMSFQKSQNYDI